MVAELLSLNGQNYKKNTSCVLYLWLRLLVVPSTIVNIKFKNLTDLTVTMNLNKKI